MSTCTVQLQSGPRLWKAHDLYNEGEGTIEGKFGYLDYSLICLDFDLSGGISMHSYDVQLSLQRCLAQGFPEQESHPYPQRTCVPTLGRFSIELYSLLGIGAIFRRLFLAFSQETSGGFILPLCSSHSVFQEQQIYILNLGHWVLPPCSSSTFKDCVVQSYRYIRGRKFQVFQLEIL